VACKKRETCLPSSVLVLALVLTITVKIIDAASSETRQNWECDAIKQEI
jgi:hypothetical protein